MSHDEYIPRIAAKLFNHGITFENYSTEKAHSVLANTVNPNFCKAILSNYETEVKEKIAEFQLANQND